VQRDRGGGQLGGVLDAAGADPVDAQALEEGPAQPFGRGDVQAGPAVEQRPLLEKAVGDGGSGGRRPSCGPWRSGPSRARPRRLRSARANRRSVRPSASAWRLLASIGTSPSVELSIGGGWRPPLPIARSASEPNDGGFRECAKRALPHVDACWASTSTAALRGASTPWRRKRSCRSVLLSSAKTPRAHRDYLKPLRERRSRAPVPTKPVAAGPAREAKPVAPLSPHPLRVQ